MQKQFDFSEFFVFFIRKWKFVFINWIIICIVAVVYSFFIAKKQFVSSVTFLPPFEEQSIFSLLPGGSFSTFSTSDIIPQQIITIFESKSLRRKIIEKFNLYEKYNLLKSENKFERALKFLRNDMTIEIDEVGTLGLTKHIAYTIQCYHTSPDTCYEMAQHSFFLLDSVIREVSIDRGKRNRKFVEEQLSLNKQILDSLQHEFEQFQKENKVYNISGQIQLVLNNYGQINAQLIANNIKLKNLRKDYNDTYPIILGLKKENRVLRSKLLQMEKTKKPDVMIGLEKSAEMMPRYTDFLRDIEVQNKLILLLTQQLEESKLKESRDISALKIIDMPFVPEYKIRPKRIFLAVGIVGVYFVFLIMGIFSLYFYKTFIRETVLFNEIISIFKQR